MAGKIVSIFNTISNSGKSWVVQNLSKNLSIFNRVLIIDLDPCGDSSSYFQVLQEFSIKDILEKRQDFPHVVQKTENKNLYIIPANVELIQLTHENINQDRIVHIANYLKTKFDYIVIDNPSCNTPLVQSWLDVSDEVVYPVTFDSGTILYLDRFFQEFEKIRDRAGLVGIGDGEERGAVYEKYRDRFIQRGEEPINLQIGQNEISKFNHIILSFRK